MAWGELMHAAQLKSFVARFQLISAAWYFWPFIIAKPLQTWFAMQAGFRSVSITVLHNFFRSRNCRRTACSGISVHCATTAVATLAKKTKMRVNKWITFFDNKDSAQFNMDASQQFIIHNLFVTFFNDIFRTMVLWPLMWRRPWLRHVFSDFFFEGNIANTNAVKAVAGEFLLDSLEHAQSKSNYKSIIFGCCRFQRAFSEYLPKAWKIISLRTIAS